MKKVIDNDPKPAEIHILIPQETWNGMLVHWARFGFKSPKAFGSFLEGWLTNECFSTIAHNLRVFENLDLRCFGVVTADPDFYPDEDPETKE